LGLVLLVTLAVACSPSAPSGQPQAGAGPAAQPTRMKRITASVMGDITSFVSRLSMTQISPAGASAIEQLVNGSLAELNGAWKLSPQLGESVPSLENGQWRALPDGRMETIWKIRSDVVWHDGAPLTADDFVFTTVVDRDRDLPIPRQPAYVLVDTVEAVDPRTVRVVWKSPYIEADQFFTTRVVPPLPKHLLEEAYLNEKAQFTNLAYWSEHYVGAGPYTVKSRVPGSSITLQAFDKYALGRPKVDEIEIRVFLDLNTLVTNLASGTVELTLGRGFTAEHAIQLRDQWRDGVVETNPRSWVVINPQFIDPKPAIVLDPQFRRALLYATDRQQLVDTLQGGMTPVADMFINPTFPEFNDVKDAAIRYPYDQRLATQLIEGLGYTKGPDGTYRDGTGERLAVELRNNTEVITEKTVVPVADLWSRLGVATEPIIVPPQRISDRQWVAEFPAFRMMRQPNDTIQLTRLHSQFTPLPENGYAGSNYARYRSAELDALLDRYVSTIPWDERMQVLRQTIRHMTDQLNNMGLFYDMEFTLASKRLKDVTAREVTIWDVHKWDVN
jgi:peptide/nickel transport system substrate-binding protein